MATTKTSSASGGGKATFSGGSKPQPNVGRALGNVLPARQRSITYEDDAVDHWISDAELDQLSELRKDNVVELFWGTLGVFLGSLTPAMEKLPKIGNREDPLNMIDTVILVTCVATFILTIIMAFFWFQRSGKAKDLTTKIRDRKKFQVNDNGS